VTVTIRPLARDDWPAIAALFGDKGACGGCWCMYWRVERGGRAWDELRGDKAERKFRSLVMAGKARGLLAFSGATPVGWVCVGPYEDFPRLGRVRALERARPAGTWSIVCFYIPPRHRRTGLATKLLTAARDLAFRRGARVVEGYPVIVRTDQGLPGAFAWTGVPAMFASTGFRQLAGPHPDRHVWLSEAE
jgi:GNAT superfamily N-acetyltransferase